MLKLTGPKIGANGKMVKLTIDKMVKLGNVKAGRGDKMVKMLKSTGPKIDTKGKIAKPLSALKRYSLVDG